MDQKCPICGSNQSYLFLKRENVPIYQNVIVPNQELAVKFRGGKISLLACQKCGFISNYEYDKNAIVYNQTYDNCQFHSKYFSDYVNDLIYCLLEEYKIRHSRIIEIGCGQGEFLKRLIQKTEYNNIGLGFDPSYRGEESVLNGRIKFYKEYYTEESADIEGDVIVCRHVIEHISDPLSTLKTIKKAIGNRKNVLLFFETPCVNWILNNHVIWDLFYEHCSYFNENSIYTAFVNAGFTIREIKHIFEGQYLWVEAYSDGTNLDIPQFSWMEFKSSIDDFVENEKQTVATWHNYIESLLNEKYNIAIWGAGAKGVTFANLIDPYCTLIDCVIDINPNKQGKYLPGTGHFITDMETAVQRGVTHVIIMNPNYLTEIQQLLTYNKINLQLIQDIKNV